MPRIVDGDNLLGTWPGRKRSDRERKALAHDLDRWAHRERRRLVVVFDGSAPPGVSLGSHTRFAGPVGCADDVILALLRQQVDPRGCIVVTNDRSLGDQCRGLGARIEKCEAFRARLLVDGGSEKPIPSGSIDEWLEVFSEGTSGSD